MFTVCIFVLGTHEEALKKLQDLQCPVKEMKVKEIDPAAKIQKLFDVPKFDINHLNNLTSTQPKDINNLIV